jgi:hypothetical protein
VWWKTPYHVGKVCWKTPYLAIQGVLEINHKPDVYNHTNNNQTDVVALSEKRIPKWIASSFAPRAVLEYDLPKQA